MSGDVGLVVNPKPGASVVMAGFGGAACAVAVMLVLFWAALPVFAQQSCPAPVWEEAGTVDNPYQIETLCELQAINADLGKHYMLVKDIIATRTANWNVEEGIARGFEPIAAGIDGGFTGSFVNGGDHVISSLYINRPNTDNVGLFSRLAAGATVRGVILSNSDTVGRYLVGPLAGVSQGTIEDCSVLSLGGQSVVSASGRIVQDFSLSIVGGLVGQNLEGGSISNSYTQVTVNGASDVVGGLVGENSGNISNSRAEALVKGRTNVGGLVGTNELEGHTGNSYAAGNVEGSIGNTGGLAGNNKGNISNSFAAATVSGVLRVGGLVGSNEGLISYSYAVASVSGDESVGGLVGYHVSFSIVGTAVYIRDSYATGSVLGNKYVGGLVGNIEQGPLLSNSFATGSVWGDSNAGGLVGRLAAGVIRNSYYARKPDSQDVLGQERTFGQLRCPTNSGAYCGPEEAMITYSTWDTDIWDFGTTTELPQLRGNRNPGLNVKPYIKGPVELPFGVNPVESFSSLALVAGYTGAQPQESVTLTWSLDGLPTTLEGLVYFSLADGTTALTAIGDVATLFATRKSIGLAEGEVFYVALMNGVSVTGDRIRIRIVEADQPSIADPADPAEWVVGVGKRVPGAALVVFKVGYKGPDSVTDDKLTWSFVVPPDIQSGVIHFLSDDINATTAKGSSATLYIPYVIAATAGFRNFDFEVVLKNGVSVNGDSVRVRVVNAQQPFLAFAERIVRVGTVPGATRLNLGVTSPGYQGDSVILTRSLPELPTALMGLVYFDLGDGTTSTEVTGQNAELVVVRNERLPVPESFVVELTNNISVYPPALLRVLIRKATALPMVIRREGEIPAEDGGLIRTILEEATSSTLTVAASDPYGDDFGDLSWSFVSRDLAPGAGVEFSASTMGDVVELRVTRPLELYDVGSFVLGITSGSGAYTTVTVVIATGCSAVRGADLMSGQTGDGTSASPYQIRRLCQLQGMRSSPSAYYELAADIDASPTRNWNDGKGFEPIASDTNRGGGFSGSFVSSSNYVITGLTINRPSTDNVALFSRLAEGATIRGVILIDSRTTGRNNVGSLVGFGSGAIENSRSSGWVSGQDSVGGLVGSNSAVASVSYSSAAGRVSGQDDVGGLVGANVGTIRNNYAMASVSGNKNVGGLVGSHVTAAIRNNYATGWVLGNENVGGLVGSNQSSLEFSNSYTTGSVWGNSNVGGLVGQSVADTIRNSHYARGPDNNLGTKRSFEQLRCPTVPRASCPSGDMFTYEDWDASVWDFGAAATELPQLQGNRNPDLNVRPYISGPVELLIMVDPVQGFGSLVLRADYVGAQSQESVTLTWSLAGLPATLEGLVYFSLANGTTATTAIGNLATLSATIESVDLAVDKSFYVVLMNGVSVNGDQVRIRVVEEGQPFIAGLGERTAAVGDGVSGFSNLVFEVDYPGPPGESVTLTWSLPELPDELSGFVYFSLADGTTATTATGSNTTLSVTRNADRLAAGTSLKVVLMNNVAIRGDSVQVQVVEGQQATIDGAAEQVVLEGRIPVTTSLDFKVADAGYGGESAILTWSLSELPTTLTGLVYFDLGDGTTATTASGSSAKLVVARQEGFPVPASFDVLLVNDVSVYAAARVGVRVVGAGQPVIAGLGEQTVAVGNGVSGFEHLDFEVDDRGSSEESIIWTWSLSGLSGELSSYVYFSLANGTAATTATGSNTTLSVTRNADELAAGTSFAVVLMNGVSTSRASVRIQTVDARQATIDGSTERVVLEGTVPGTTSLDFEVADAGYGEGSAILTWSLAGLPDELSNFVYFDLGDGATATTARGSIAKLVITRHEGFPVPASFDVLLMNNVSVYASARVRVRVVAEGQPVIAGSTVRTVVVGNGVSGFSNLVFVAAVAEPSEESITWTWSLSGLSGELSSYVYFSLADGAPATTATGSNTTLSVTRNADELAAGTSFAVVLMNGVSTSRASVRIQTVDARQATIDGSTERVVLEGTVPGTTSLDFEVADAGYGEGSAILTWSLAGLPDELSNFVYFDLGDGATATTARGSIAKLVIVRNERFPVPASFDVLLMNNVSVYASARVRVRVVAEGQPVIAGSTARTVAVGNGVSGFSNLVFVAAAAEPSEESIIWTWSLAGLSGELSSYVYFSLANGTAATTATGSNTTLSVTRNAGELAAGTSFAVVLMNGVSTSRASVRIQTVDARQATIDGSTERVVLEGTVPGTTSLDFEVADAGYGEGSAILTWSLAGLPDELSNFVYFDLGDGATVTTARGSIAKLVITRHEGFPVPASFDVLLMNNVSVYAATRVGVRVVAEGQPVIAGSTVRTVVVGNGVSGFEHLDFEVDDRGSSEESIIWTWSLSGLSGELSSYVYFSLANGTAATTATGSNTTLSVTRNADELAAGTSFAVVLMNGVSTSRASVRIQTVDARQATIDGSTERVVLEGTVPGTTSLDFEVADAGYGEGSAILTWSLAGLPDELSNFVYFDLGDGATATTARGSIAKLVVVRHAGFPVPASFDVLLMNDVSVYAAARIRVRVVEEGRPSIAGSAVRTVAIGNDVTGFSNLVFVAAVAEPSEESIIWTWSLSGLSGELSSYVYFSLANGTAATTATGSNTTLSVTRNADELAAGTSFAVVLMNGVSTSRASVRIQTVDARQATIDGSTERVVLEGTVPGTTSLDFEVADAGYGEGSAILTWSLAGLPDELSNFVYFDLGDGATATTARGSIAKLVITRHEGFPVPASFDVLLMNNVSVYASARVRVRVVAEGQPVIVGSDERIAAVGNGVSGFSNLNFELGDTGSSGESITWTWSLSGLPDELSSYVYFSLANGTAATTATGSNTTLSVTRNAGELAAGTSFAVVLMNGVSTSRASVRIQTVDARQATIDGSTERVVLEGTVPGTTSLDFEVADAGYGEGSAILTWSLAGLPDELSNFIYFDLGDGATATTARGSIAKLVITRHEGFPVPASFDVLLMNNVSVYASARVRVRVVAEGQPVIVGSTVRTVVVGNGVSGFEHLDFEVDDRGSSEESISWTWSLAGLSGELSSYVYFSLANGTAATTATGSNTTLSVTRNAAELAAGTSFEVVLMNGVSTSRASVRIQTVDARQATIAGSTERVVLEGTVPGTTSLDFEVADAGYGEGSAILTWSLAGLPDELSNFVYFDLGDGATATTARGSIAKLVVVRHAGFPVPASFDVLLMNDVSVYAAARMRVRVVEEGRPSIAGSAVRTVTVGNGVSGFSNLVFVAAAAEPSEESISWTWSLAGLSGELSSYVYFSLANGTAATTATGSNTTLSVTRNADELAAGTSFAVVLMNGVSTSRASVRIQTVDARQATIDGSTERVVLEGTVPGTTSLDFEVADAGYGEGSAILTWSLAGLPDELSNFVYFDLGDGATATTARGSIAKLVITRHEGFPVPASFDVLLMNNVSVYASARVRVRVVAEGQPVIVGSDERIAAVGNGVSGFSNLNFELDDTGSSGESITWTWSLSGLSGELSSYVYFSLANGTAATTATGSNTTLSVTRNAGELAAGTSFAVVLMNGVSTSRASVRIQTVDARQATIDGSTERVVLEGTVPGTTSLDFEVADAGYGEGSAILTWSLAGLPDELSNFIYFDLGDGATATTARGSIAKLVITRHEGFPVPASFDVLLMNNVSVYASARVRVRVVAEGQPVIVGSTVRTVVVGNGVSGFEHLDFEVDDRGSSEESISWTWSLAGLSGELSSYVYFSLANGTAATTATGSNTTLSVTRNAGELAAGTSFAVVLMNGVSTSRASVRIQTVDARQATIDGSTERVVLEGTVPGTTSLDFEVADAGYGEGSAILTWSLAGLPDELSNFVYFDLGDGATATTARGSIAKLVITRHEGFPVPASFDVLLMNDVSVYASARVRVRVVAEGQPVIAGSTVRTVTVGNGVSGFSNLVFVAAVAEPSEESIIWTWSLSGLSGELSSYVYFSLANGTAATTATGSNTTLSVTRNADELAAGTSFAVVLMNGVSTSRASVRIQTVDARQATIDGSTERVVLEGRIPVTTSLDFKVADAGYGEGSAILTWSLAGLPDELSNFVYFDLGDGATATTARGSIAKLVITRHEGFPVPASFDVLLMNNVSVYAPARVGVRVVAEGQPVIAGSTVRTVVVGNGVSGFSNLVFVAAAAEPSEESIIWTWSLSGLSGELSSYVYFSLANGTAATTATGSNTTLSVTRNADELAAGTGFAVVLMNGVSTSRASVRIQTVDARQATIDGSTERVVLEGTVPGTTSLDFEVADAGYGGGSAILTWSLSELPSTLTGLVYFDLGDGTTATTARGSIAKLVITRHEGFPVPASFDVLLMNDVSVYAPARVGVRVVAEGQPVIAGSTVRTVVVGNGVSGFSNLDFEVDDRGSSEESITWSWSLSGLSGELSSYVYFSLANGTAATTATGSNTTLSVTRNADELAAGTSFAVVLMNGVSTSRASVRIQTVDARQATIDGSTERVVLEGTVPGTTSLDFEVADAGYGEGSAILTWSLAGLPDELSNFVYFDLGDGATATTARGSIAKLVITRHEGFPVPADFYVLLMNNVSVYAPARVRVRVVAEGQPVIAGSTVRTVTVGNGVSGFSNLNFELDDTGSLEESISWTWSLAGLSGELSSYVYFSLANGTAATTATGSNTTLSVTRNADELAVGTSFAVVLMNGVSTSRASVRIQTVDARQATIDGSTERVVLEGTVPGTTSLDFEVADAGYGEGSAILTWSLAGLPDELSNFVYFDLGDGATATTARGSIAKLVITRHEGFPVPADFYVLLMNNVSVYAPARVRVRVVAEGQPVIAGSTVRTVTVGNGVSGFSNLNFELDDTGSSEESISWTWSLAGLSGELSSYVYFSLANGTAATTATGSNTTLSVTRNADELAAGTSFAVVLMNGVSTSRASVRIQTVDARQATIDGSTERVVLEGTVPGTTSLDFEVADAGYGEGSAILTWSLAGLPDELSNFVYFDLGDGATATTARGSIAKLVITRHEGFPVPASFDVLLMNNVSVYAAARVRVRVVAEGQPVIAGSTVRTVTVGNGVSGFSNLVFVAAVAEPSEESIIWTWSLSGLSGELSSYVYFSLANGTAATTATGSNTTLSVTRNADELAAGTSFAVVLMNGVSTSRASVRIQTVDARQATIDGSTERVVLEGTVPGTTSLDFEVADAGYEEGSAILTWSLAGLPDELSNFVYFDLGDGATATTARGSIAKLVITRHEGFPVPASFDVLLMNNVSVYAPARVQIRVVAEGQPVIAGSTVRTVTVGNGVSGFSNLVFVAAVAEPSEESIIWTWSLSGLSGELSSYVYFSLANGTAATTATGSNTTLSVTRNADELAAGTSFAVVLMNGVSTSRASVRIQTVDARQATIDGSTERVVLEGTVPGTTSLDFEVADAGYEEGSAILTWSLAGLPDELSNFVYFDLGDGATATTARGSIAKLVITRHEGFPVPASFDVLLMNNVSVYAPARVQIRVVAEGQPVIAGSTVRTVAVGNGVSGFSNLNFELDDTGSSEESITWSWSLSGLSGELSSYVYFSLANGTAATTATGSNTTLSVTRNADELAAGTSFAVVLMNGVSVNGDRVQIRAVDAMQATIADAAEPRVVRVGTVPAASTSLDFEVADAGYGGGSAILTWSLSELPSTLTGLVYFDLGDGATATTARGSIAKLVIVRNERLPVPASFDVLLMNDVSVYAAARVQIRIVAEGQPVVAGPVERTVAVGNGVSGFSNLVFEVDDTGSSEESVTLAWSLSELPITLQSLVYFSLADGTTATTATGSNTTLSVTRNADDLVDGTSFAVVLMNGVSVNGDRVQVRAVDAMQATIADAAEPRVVRVGTVPAANSRLDLRVENRGYGGESAILTWSLSGLPTTLTGLVYFDLGEGTTATTASDSIAKLVIVRNERLPVPASFDVLLMNDVSVYAPARVQIRIVAEGQPVVAGPVERTVAVGNGVSGFSNLVFEVGDTGSSEESVTLAWSLAEFPTPLRGLVYFSLAGGTTATTATGSNATLSVTRNADRLADGTSFYVVLMNGVSVNGDRVRIRVVDAMQATIAGSTERVVRVGTVPAANSRLGLGVENRGYGGESAILTWSLSGLPTTLTGLVYFDLGEGTTATTASDSIAKLVIIRNERLPVPASFDVLLMNDVSVYAPARVQIRIVEATPPIMDSQALRIRLYLGGATR